MQAIMSTAPQEDDDERTLDQWHRLILHHDTAMRRILSKAAHKLHKRLWIRTDMTTDQNPDNCPAWVPF